MGFVVSSGMVLVVGMKVQMDGSGCYVKLLYAKVLSVV